MARNWRTVSAEANLDEEKIAEHGARQMAQVRAHRLAEVRARRVVTQTDLAAALGISQSRVSAIERGGIEAAELATISRYVEALGGRLEIVADFGDERLVLG